MYCVMYLISTVLYHTRQVHVLHLDGLCLGDMDVWGFSTDAPAGSVSLLSVLF